MTDGPRLVIVSGKGGVGKSAVAAAMALAAHRRGGRVLAVAMTGDGGGLAAHLGVPPLQFDIREDRPGLFTTVVERTQALREYLHLQVGLPPIVAFGPAVRAFDSLASTAPAVREIVTMGKVLWEVKRQEWDLVVADGPPTGQIGSFLRAARTISELVPSGRIREQAAWMERILLEPGIATLSLVTLAEELPTSETEETLSWLDSEQLVTTVEVIANRILEPLDWSGDGLPSGRAGEAARLHMSLSSEQERWLSALPTERQLPFMFGTMTPTEVSARLADEIEAWA
jgi:anion-transporting  ArsA/GET3 family ATPase